VEGVGVVVVLHCRVAQRHRIAVVRVGR